MKTILFIIAATLFSLQIYAETCAEKKSQTKIQKKQHKLDEKLKELEEAKSKKSSP